MIHRGLTWDHPRGYAALAAAAAMNPIRLLTAMASSEAIALIPHVYGYVNYARSAEGQRTVSFGDAPILKTGGRPSSVLGGTGIAITRRTELDAALLDHLRWLMRPETQAGFIPDHEGSLRRAPHGSRSASIPRPVTSTDPPWRRWNNRG
jgi:hypothetical protein